MKMFYRWCVDCIYFLMHFAELSLQSNLKCMTWVSVTRRTSFSTTSLYLLNSCRFSHVFSVFLQILHACRGDVFVAHELFLSLCPLSCHPIHVGDCSCKSLVINRNFWYAKKQKQQKRKWLNGISETLLGVLAFLACFDNEWCIFFFFVICILSIWISAVCRVSIHIGLSLLTIFNLCLIAFPQTVLVMHKMLRETVVFMVCFFSPFFE